MVNEIQKYFEDKKISRSRRRWRFLAIILTILLVIGLISQLTGYEEADFVAVIDVENIIFDSPERTKQLQVVEEDTNVRALLVRINSPGGTVVGGEILYSKLRSVSKHKPVVALMGEVATSAGYMAALGADYIFARRATITGSIGVLMQTADVTELLKKLGVKPASIKSSPLKAQPNPLESFSEQAKLETRRIVSDIHEMFVEIVSKRRGMSLEKAKILSDGRIFTGREALSNGLIDRIGGEKEARHWLFTSRGIKIEVPLKKLSLSENQNRLIEFVKDFLGKTPIYDRLRLDGLISLWQPSIW